MKKFTGRTLSSVILAAWVSFSSSIAVQAQGIEYKEETRMRLEGLGLVGRLIGRTTVESTNYVQGAIMRVDSEGNTSTISDMEGGRIINLNHKAKEYTVITFAEMLQMAEQMQENLKQKMEEAKAEQPEEEGGEAAEEEQEEVTTKFEFEFDAKATGEKEDVFGYEAEQLVMTLKVIFEAEGEDEEGNQETMKGNFFAVVDHWASDAIPGYEEISEYQRQAAEKMGSEMGSSGLAESMQQAFQADPRMAAAMTRVAEELEKVEGMPLRSTTYFVLASEGAELDLDAVLGKKKEEKKGPNLGGLARGALRSRGIAVRGDSQPKDESTEPSQKTLVSITTEMKDIKTGALDPALFQVPAGYTEVKFEGLGQ